MAHSKDRGFERGVPEKRTYLSRSSGKPDFITKEFVEPGAAVFDVGINRTESGICGDVDFENVKEVAGWITMFQVGSEQ